jgi:hypothetical protein
MMLALFGFISWRAVPVMPVEIMLLPRWFAFHLDKVSYWSRTVIVPLLVLQTLKPRARNPKGVGIEELFLEPPRTIGLAPKAPQQKVTWFWFFRGVDAALRFGAPMFPKRLRQRAIDRAVAWVTERLNGQDGLGAIFPAMVRCAWLSGAPSAALDRAQIHRQAPRRARARGLLPTVRLADLGHLARLPQFARSRRRARRCPGEPRTRMAGATASPRR